MIRLDHQPSTTDLRLFGASLSLLLGMIGAGLYWKLGLHGPAYILWIAAVGLSIGYYACPAIQRPLYRAWIVALFPLAWLMSAIILGILYFGLVTPIALAGRLCGRDPLQLRTARESYWIPRPLPTSGKARYFRTH